MGGGGIPDRWVPYKAKGNVVEGTKFISFKVPLKITLQKGLKSIWDVATLLSAVPDIGIVIDLTNTDRYYNSQDIVSNGVLYQKIMCPGRVIPPETVVQTFFKIVDEFILSGSEKLIGVHCTHGLNRTGYFVCRYMRDKMGFSAEEAIKLFETARGYRIERENFIADLKGEEPLPSDVGRHTKIIPIRPQDKRISFKPSKPRLDARRRDRSANVLAQTKKAFVPNPTNIIRSFANRRNYNNDTKGLFNAANKNDFETNNAHRYSYTQNKAFITNGCPQSSDANQRITRIRYAGQIDGTNSATTPRQHNLNVTTSYNAGNRPFESRYNPQSIRRFTETNFYTPGGSDSQSRHSRRDRPQDNERKVLLETPEGYKRR